jgi:phage gpG-like protein
MAQTFTVSDLLGKIPDKLEFTAKGRLGRASIDVSGPSAGDMDARFQAASQRAAERIAVDLKAALSDAMRSSVWSTPSGSGDIVDTGELLASGTVTVNKDGVTIAYDAPYAALVHFGGYINPFGNTRVRVYLPPRPWVESVLFGGGPVEEFDFSRYYQEEFQKVFSV